MPCVHAMACQKLAAPSSEVTPKSQTNNFLGSLNVYNLFL